MIKTKATLIVVTMTALCFTVPWFFFDHGDEPPTTILGFPSWAFYAVVSSFLYACLISFCLGRYWELMAHSDEDET